MQVSDESSVRCWGSGSGLCEKFPCGAQCSLNIFFTPSAYSNSGMAIPPTEFTQSIATLKFAFFIASISTRSSDNIDWICLCRNCFWVISPSWSTSENSNSSFSAIFNINSPSVAFKNSPWLLRSLRAFHCFGLWLAVIIIPPEAFSFFTAIPVVGVVAIPISVTSQPMPINVAVIILWTISPEIRASLPTIIKGRLFWEDSFIKVA